MSELRKRKNAVEQSANLQDRNNAASEPALEKKKKNTSSVSFSGIVFLLVLTAAAAAVGAHHRQIINLRDVQQQLLQQIQQHVSPYVHKLSGHVVSLQGSSSSGSSSSSSGSNSSSSDYLFTRDELALYTGDHPAHKGQIYIAILGQVFDVSKAPHFYGRGEGYGHFAGTDGSKSFITGDFVGDVTDDVSGLDPEACLGLTGWRDFYHKEYTFKGKLVGNFYDASGAATAALEDVLEKAKEGERIKAARKAEEANWPPCHMKWTQEEGGSVWCEGGQYPRKLYVEMKAGKAVWRCACFKELGWSDVRKVYVDCEPDAHHCKVNAEAEAPDEDRDMQAEFEAMFG